MNSVEQESSSASVDTSLDSESDFTCVTETQCEISEDLLNYDSVAVSSTESLSESQEIPKTSKAKGRDLPNMTSPYWYTSPCFSRYWKHYQKVMTWYQKHLQVYKSLQYQYSLENTRRHSTEQHRFRWKRSHKKRKKRAPKQRSRKLRVDLSDSNASSIKKEDASVNEEPMSGAEAPEKENELSETDEYEMEITDEMIEFFAKSQQHRKDRDAKNKENGSKPAETVNIEDAHKPIRTVEAPKERPGVRRTAEMKLLYGKGAAMIHGMETALKMTYDRNLDVKQPKVWPNIPLRIVFAD